MKKPSNRQSGFVYIEDILDYVDKKFLEHQTNANIPVLNEQMAGQHNIALGHLMLLEDLKAWTIDQAAVNNGDN